MNENGTSKLKYIAKLTAVVVICAALLTGGLLWGSGHNLKLSLDRGDLWDLRTPDTLLRDDWTWATIRKLVAQKNQKRISELFDVRTPEERAKGTIEGARFVDEEIVVYIENLDRDTPVAFHCHHGVRSLSAAEHFIGKGFKKVYNLAGGIDAWSVQVDSNVPRY